MWTNFSFTFCQLDQLRYRTYRFYTFIVQEKVKATEYNVVVINYNYDNLLMGYMCASECTPPFNT